MYSVSEVMESRNVAVIGASRDPVKLGALLLKVLKDTGLHSTFFQRWPFGSLPTCGDMPER